MLRLLQALKREIKEIELTKFSPEEKICLKQIQLSLANKAQPIIEQQTYIQISTT